MTKEPIPLNEIEEQIMARMGQIASRAGYIYSVLPQYAPYDVGDALEELCKRVVRDGVVRQPLLTKRHSNHCTWFKKI